MFHNDYNNLLLRNNFILILLLILLFLFIPKFSYAQRDILHESNLNKEEIDLKNYVEEIYLEYAKKNFNYIYKILHPGIKELLTEEEYEYYQKENFKKYKIKISEIEVGSKLEKIKLPNKFKNVVNNDIENKDIYKIPISYKMDLTVIGEEQTRKIDNQVYIIIDNKQYFLLWDPTVIKKNEDDEEN